MVGADRVPVRVVNGCAKQSGKKVTYFKTLNKISVLGEELRTQS